MTATMRDAIPEVDEADIEELSARDVRAMMSVGEARIPEYVDDDSDLLVDDE